ncbi:hypothetical protein Tco_0291383 [Tanacetum coccineum]
MDDEGERWRSGEEESWGDWDKEGKRREEKAEGEKRVNGREQKGMEGRGSERELKKGRKKMEESEGGMRREEGKGEDGGRREMRRWYERMIRGEREDEGSGERIEEGEDGGKERERVIMPRKTSEDHQNTRDYIPIISHEYTSPLKEMLRNLESRRIHEGRVVYQNFADLVYIRFMFSFIEFECLLEISKQIYPRFILEFYIQYHIEYSDKGQMLIQFVIQNQFFSYTFEEFGQILDIPYEGACVFTNKWSLNDLKNGVPRGVPYHTDPPSPDDIIAHVREEREGQVTRIRHDQQIDVEDYQILTCEIMSCMKPYPGKCFLSGG